MSARVETRHQADRLAEQAGGSVFTGSDTAALESVPCFAAGVPQAEDKASGTKTIKLGD